MDKLKDDYSEATLEKLIEKEFVEWLIENLTPDEMLWILDGIEMEIRRIKGKKLPKLFLKNKLLIKTTRVKLRDKEVFPPFKWIMENEGKLTEENIIKLADDLKVPKREKALSLFLQNHYDEALKLYGDKDSEDMDRKIFDEKVGVEEKPKEQKVSTQENKTSSKVEKKISQKLLNLESEREKLQTQLKALQQEMKEKLAAKQNEINRLNGLLITEKKESEKAIEKVLSEAKTEKESIIKEINFLKEENDELKFKGNSVSMKLHETGGKKTRIALLGDPKNRGILKNEKYDIEIFEHENFMGILDRVKDFKFVYLLTWRFSIEEFEAQANSEIKKITTRIPSFADLRKKLEETTHVN